MKAAYANLSNDPSSKTLLCCATHRDGLPISDQERLELGRRELASLGLPGRVYLAEFDPRP